MAKYVIKYDKGACNGCGLCANTCPENWTMVDSSDERKAKPKQLFITEDDYYSNMEAADNCPVDAITIKTNKERTIDLEDSSDFMDF